MNETKWREEDDPEVLAAAVAAGVEVQYGDPVKGKWFRQAPIAAEDATAYFARWLGIGVHHRLPADWQPTPEHPADDLRERIKRVIDDWHSTVEMWSELDDLADAVLAVLPAPPVPPWPGAVPSGLVDEDGEPTWLAQAGQVRGEQVRGVRGGPWRPNTLHYALEWVEVRAPRAVPEPETERVSWWEAVGRAVQPGMEVVESGADRQGPWVRVCMGGTKLYSLVDPDGTVEVLREGGER